MENGGLLAGIMNPAQVDVLGSMDKGRERQAKNMAGDILSQTMAGKLGALAKLDPDTAIKLQGALGTQNKERLNNMIGVSVMASKLYDAGLTGEAEQFLREEASKVESLTGEPAPRLILAADAMASGNTEVLGNFQTFARSLDPSRPKPEYAQSSNKDMKGWVFDKTSGQFSLDPNYQKFLESDAGRLANKDMLSAKDVAGVNDKVTGLIKDGVGINKAANDLIALETSGTTSDQIAAVFKFMKAMDPSSTVRESELGMVYNAEGAAQGFANYVNSLVQGKKIDPEGFKKIVNTAKTLSNSAVAASNGEVERYTDVISDNLTGKQLKSIKARVPGLFEIVQPSTQPPPQNSQGWGLQIDANGNKAYVGPNGEIEEVN